MVGLTVWRSDGEGINYARICRNIHSRADAQLIAASPYMLKALKSIIAVLDGRQPKDIPGAIMAAQTAIDCATNPILAEPQ